MVIALEEKSLEMLKNMIMKIWFIRLTESSVEEKSRGSLLDLITFFITFNFSVIFSLLFIYFPFFILQIGLKHSYIAIASVIIFVTVLNGPNFLIYKIREDKLNESCVVRDQRYIDEPAYIPDQSDLAKQDNCLVGLFFSFLSGFLKFCWLMKTTRLFSFNSPSSLPSPQFCCFTSYRRFLAPKNPCQTKCLPRWSI